MLDWFTSTPTDLLAVVLSALGIYVALITFTQIAGLRSFSKMSGFDFAMTVAIGSIVASSVLTNSPPLAQAVVALGALYVIQIAVAIGRQKSDLVSRLVDNEPLLIMTADGILHDNLKKARMTEGDLWAKLREANVIDPVEVRAVVMETTGDVSVLHADPGGRELHPKLLSGVRDASRVGHIRSDNVPSPAGDPFA